jgi:hypothetical protein
MRLTAFKFLAVAWMLLICELKSTYVPIFSIASSLQPHNHCFYSSIIVPHTNNGQSLLKFVHYSKLVLGDVTFVIQKHML